MPWNEFNAIHQTIFDTIMKEYIGSLVGTLKQIQGFKEKFQCDMEEAKKPYQDKNSKELYAFNIGQAKTLWNQLIEPGLKFDQLFVSIYSPHQPETRRLLIFDYSRYVLYDID